MGGFHLYGENPLTNVLLVCDTVAFPALLIIF